MTKVFIFLVYGYRWLISPALHSLMPVRSGCRFPQTCSEFLIHTLESDGLIAGVRKGAVRLSQCHSFGMSKYTS